MFAFALAIARVHDLKKKKKIGIRWSIMTSTSLDNRPVRTALDPMAAAVSCTYILRSMHACAPWLQLRYRNTT